MQLDQPIQRSRRARSAPGALAVALALAFTVLAGDPREARADARAFDINADVAVRLNWQSFLDAGFPASWEGSVVDTIIAAYTRWIHVGGMKLRPKFQGYTTRTAADPNEILVIANLQHSGWFDGSGNACTSGSPGCACVDCNRLASRFGSGNRVLIVIHRRSAFSGSVWPHVFWRTQNAGDFDDRGVLLHEMGHAFGLEHEDSAEAVMHPFQIWHHAYGPNKKDVEDIVALYGTQDAWRVHVRRTIDDGATYGELGSNLPGIGVSTTQPASPVRDLTRSIYYYTSIDHRPSWIVGTSDGLTFNTAQWFTFGGFPSIYGAAAHGWGDEYMMAWVDHSTDQDTINVVRSTDGGLTYFWANPPASRTMGTPAIHKLADNTWILAYTKLGPNAGGLGDTGRIMARISTNDGASWSGEVELNGFYRADNGVSLASNGPGEIRLGFAWAQPAAASPNYLKRTIVAHLDVSNNLVYDRMIYENEVSRNQPVMTKPLGRFLQAWREPNYATSIDTRTSVTASSTWDNYYRPLETSHVVPGLAAIKNASFAFLYTVE